MPLDAAQWQIQITAADKTSAAFASIDRRLAEMSSNMNSLSKDINGGFAAINRAASALGITLSAAAAAARVWQAGMKAADMGEQAAQIGLTTDQLQAYRLVAVQNNVTVEQLDGAMMKFTRTMGEAYNGNENSIKSFEKLGVKILDANGNLRKQADVLPEVARGLLGLASEGDRNAVMMEQFGRSGMRMTTMLEELAKGNEELVRSAADQGALVSPENIAKWDALSDRLAKAKEKSDALYATLAAPAAQAAADALDRIANNAARATTALNSLPKDATFFERLQAIFGKDNNTMGGYRLSTPAEEAMDRVAAAQKRLNDLQAQQGSASGTAANTLADQIRKQQQLVTTLEAQYRAEAKVIENEAARQRLVGDGLPAQGGAPKTAGASNPVSTKGRDAGDSAQKKLDALLVERKAIEDAIGRMELVGNETVAEMNKRIDASVTLQKKINSLTEGLPKDSPLAQQMTAEATAISDLNQKLEDKRKLMQGAEQTIAKYGDGTKAAARATEDLNKQLSEGLISPQQYALAMQDITRAQQEQAIAVRGGVEGFDAFTAGMEHIISQSSKMSRSFQYGEKAVQLMDDAISQLVQNGEINFNRLLASFITTIAQMEMRAAASSLWSAFGGSSGMGGGLISGLIGGLVNVASGFSFDGMASGSMLEGLSNEAARNVASGLPGRAVGGSVSSGSPYWVGERGPELFIPDGPGRIAPDGSMDGGGVTISMTNSFGGGVTHAEMLRYGAMIEERAKAGAMAGIEAKRKRGGAIKQVFRG